MTNDNDRFYFDMADCIHWTVMYKIYKEKRKNAVYKINTLYIRVFEKKLTYEIWIEIEIHIGLYPM